MKIKMKEIIFAIIGSLLIVGSANALMIDFRTSDWSVANGNSTYTVGDVTATASSGDTLYQDLEDGLGIQGGSQNDEIDGLESLVISFNEALDLWDVLITDLFPARDGSSSTDGETGFLILYDSAGNELDSFEFFGLNSETGNGEQLVSFGTTYSVSSLKFYALDESNNEFSVAGFNTPVPEPSTVLLFGVGLVGLVGLSQRRRKNK